MWIVLAWDGIYDRIPLAVFDDEGAARSYARSRDAIADGERALDVEKPPDDIVVEGPFPFRSAESTTPAAPNPARSIGLNHWTP